MASLTNESNYTILKYTTNEHYLAFEALPYRLAPCDAHEDEPFIYTAMGTTCYQVLFPRMGVTRLVASRPRKPPVKKVTRKYTKTQWPDAHDTKGLAAFFQKKLNGGRIILDSVEVIHEDV